MMEHVLHIQLTKTPVVRNNYRKKNQMNGSNFDNEAKCIIIINNITLFKSSGHQAGLIPINRTINFPLDFEQPFAINDIGSISSRNQIPSVIS
jgi:hypothetical protein